MIDLSAIGENLEGELPDRFVALYFVGSYGTNRQIPTSDVDLILVTKAPLDGQEIEKVRKIRDKYRHLTGERVDINPRDIKTVLNHAVALKKRSTHVCGRDIRDEIQEPDVDRRIAQLTSAALMFTRRIHNVQDIDIESMSVPDADDEFLGYLDCGKELPLTDIMSLSFHAAARLAKKKRILVLDKHEIPERYATAFSDASRQFVEALFSEVRGRWHYKLPSAIKERDQLRRLCADILPFEKMVLREII